MEQDIIKWRGVRLRDATMIGTLCQQGNISPRLPLVTSVFLIQFRCLTGLPSVQVEVLT